MPPSRNAEEEALFRKVNVRVEEDLILTVKEAPLGSGEEKCPYWRTIWRACVPLANLLWGCKDALKGTNFLEISAGTAIPSVVAALCGAHVVCTDYEPEAIEMAKENALLNATTVEARVLDWHRLDACPRGAFDVVVGSEVLFDTARSEGVGRALAHALKKGGTALIADPGRPFTGKLLEVLTKGGLTAAQYQKCYFSVHISRSDTTVQPTIFIYATKGPPAKPEIRAILERKCEEWGEPPEDFIPKIDHAKVPKPPPLPPAR